jgi:predicted ATP-grasp superfamily ATP-dependent carboligase
MTASDRERLRRALGDGLRPAAVVLDVSFVNGLEAIRSLARADAPVLAVDHRPAALGLRSRLATGLLAPDPADEPAYVAFLHELHDELHEPAVVFATHDAPLELLARRQTELPALQLVGSGWDVLEPLQRKRVQLEAAERAGVEVPRTFHPQSRAEAEAAAAELRYPAIVKPSSGVEFKRRFGRPVLVCDDAAALVRAFEDARGSEPMLQEVVPGGDDSLWTVGSYTTAAGQPLGLFSGRKLLQMPRNFGTCRIGEARWREDAVHDALRLLSELSFHGIAQTELRLDERDGRLKLMEVNPRLWQWHGLARACGVDLPRMAYEDALGHPPAPVESGPEHDGKRWAAAAAHLRFARDEKAGVRGALGPLLHRDTVEATWDWRDPLPAAVQAAGLLPRGAVRAVSKARGGLKRSLRTAAGWRP